MKSFSFWQRWLVVVGVLVALFGVFMALVNSTSLFSLFNDRIDPVFWGTSAVSDGALRFRQWVYGAWGATVAGWGLTLAYIAHQPFERRERWSREALVAGLSLWYLLDTGTSLYFRVYFNALFNTLLLLLAGLPIALTWNTFEASTPSG